MSANIKKVYAELVELLEANKDKKVSTILEQVYAVAGAKQNAKNFKVDANGKVTHVFCYYHKEWEALSEVDYGVKKHSASGYNSMCKIGVNQWTKQQREAKKAESELLGLVASGQLSPDKIADEQARIEAKRTEILSREQE